MPPGLWTARGTLDPTQLIEQCCTSNPSTGYAHMNPGIYNGPPSLPAQRGKKRDPCRVPEAPSLALSRRRQGELLINNGDKCRKSIPESCQTDLDGYGMGRGGRRPWARGGLPPFQVLWTDSSVIAPHLGLAGAPGVQASTRLPRPKAASFGAERGASPRLADGGGLGNALWEAA